MAILYAERKKIEIEKMVQQVTNLILIAFGNLLVFITLGKYIHNIALMRL